MLIILTTPLVLDIVGDNLGSSNFKTPQIRENIWGV